MANENASILRLFYKILLGSEQLQNEVRILEETKSTSRHDQLKTRLKNRISKEVFERMTPEVQDYLLEVDPTDVKEAYLSTLLKLPWLSERNVASVELPLAKRLLDSTHYGMIDVKEKVLRYIACQKHLGTTYGAVLLLVGPPGVGKTSIAAAIAKAMGRPCVKISLAGVSDALFLRGAQTIFHNAKPGLITEALIRSKSFSPLILLDEIDKMGDSIEHGDPESVLLDILDSDRSRFVDNYLGLPLDLSNVIFVATANDTKKLSPILQDRLDMVELPPYKPTDKVKIVEKYLWPRLITEYRLDCLDYLCDPLEENFEHPGSLRLEEDAVQELIKRCPEEGVRDLERICRRLCESVISMYYADGTLVEAVDSKNLETLLEPIYYK